MLGGRLSLFSIRLGGWLVVGGVAGLSRSGNLDARAAVAVSGSFWNWCRW